MHKTHIFDQINSEKNVLLTYLPYFFSDHYRKQTIFFSRPYYSVSKACDIVLRLEGPQLGTILFKSRLPGPKQLSLGQMKKTEMYWFNNSCTSSLIVVV